MLGLRKLPWIICLSFVSLWAASAPMARSQARVDILETDVFYTFGGQVTFWARFSADTPPEKVQVFYKSRGDANTLVGEALIYQDELQFTLDLSSRPLRAFAEVDYYFAFEFPGETVVSPLFYFYYEDNRFDWKALQNEPFQVHWYEGDVAFAQMVLDTAQAGLLKAQTYLMLPAPEKVDIFVYASGAEMQSTLRLGGIRMIAGHASPDLGVIVVSLPPGPEQRLEMERQVPHELMHILLYEHLGERANLLPVWFNEGLASFNESLPNHEYPDTLRAAIEKESLIPMKMLCQAFPIDASYNYQAYAQSDSFVRFIHNEYGSTALRALLESYGQGLDCEKGVQQALGISLDRLERRWQSKALNQNQLTKSLALIAPWVAILFVSLFAPVFLSINSLTNKSARKR